MELADSRRLTGPNIHSGRPGAVLDIVFDTASDLAQDGVPPEVQRGALLSAWRAAARRRLDALGWGNEELWTRSFEGGASLVLSAPIDALYAATEVNESAWRCARATVLGEEPEPFEAQLELLRSAIAQEQNPALLRLQGTARERGVSLLHDDDHVSLGLGAGSRTWPARELPAPEELDWSELRDIPTAVVTGTNGKTTTVRLLAAIAAAAGKLPGFSSTDRLCIGDEVLEEGDWSGPGGTRRVLRDPRTEVGLLETARGGMARRGLALERCDVAAVLNVGTDHLGEWGVGSLAALADVKFVVARIADVLVLNADDPTVVDRAQSLEQELVWFGLQPDAPLLQRHLERGGRASLLSEGMLWLRQGDEARRVLAVEEVPITLGGVARHNLSNALAAAALADRLGLPLEAIRAGLRSFENTPRDNPGRLNHFDLNGVQVLVDFAHNPEGMAAVLEMAQALPAERRLVLLGQAGDRDDESIREMARVTWAGRPDMIVVKELTLHLRGRALGEVPALIEAELRAAGAPTESCVRCASELEAVQWALDWARPGDLLLLLVHDERDAVLALLEQLTARERAPGA